MNDSIDPRPWAADVDGGPLGLAVVGVGAFAREYVLPAVDSSEHCRTSVLVSPDLEPDRTEDPSVLSPDAFQDGVERSAYDAVYVATPNHRHEPVAGAAAAMGKPVLCEKPLAATSEAARTIRAAFADANPPLMVGYRVQFKPVVRWLRTALADGLIGTPVHAHSGVSFRVRDVAGGGTWRLDADAGGGALRDVGVYPINTLGFLLDRRLSARWADLRSAPDLGDVETHAAFALGDDDFVGVCTASFEAEPSSHLRISGTEGAVTVEEPYHPSEQPDVTVVIDGDAETISPPDFDEYAAQVDYFAQCVLRGEDPGPDGDEGVADLELVESIERLDDR